MSPRPLSPCWHHPPGKYQLERVGDFTEQCDAKLDVIIAIAKAIARSDLPLAPGEKEALFNAIRRAEGT